jgi:hypothetical protein
VKLTTLIAQTFGRTDTLSASERLRLTCINIPPPGEE